VKDSSENSAGWPAALPEVRDSVPEVDGDAIASLGATFEAHLASRESASARAAAGLAEAQLRAVCVTLVAGPPELGAEGGLSAQCSVARAVLEQAGEDAPLEVRTCRLWLACAAGERGSEAPRLWPALAREPLWAPVRALAFRALAFYGLRSVLVGLLPHEGPLSLVEADAWLEASRLQDLDVDLLDRVAVGPAEPWSSQVRERWTILLSVERALWNSERAATDLSVLVDAGRRVGAPLTLDQAEATRITRRAIAAMVRARIAHSEDPEELRSDDLGRGLPVWEREYLSGLACWQLGECDAAEAALRRAFAANPDQACIRCALAALIAPTSPDVALQMLSEAPNTTRELLVGRTSLLARARRYDEAERVLASAADSGFDAVRVSWRRGRVQAQRSVLGLRTALAERRLDWKGAEDAWAAAGAGLDKGQQESRRLFVAQRERSALSEGRQWRREILTHRLERVGRELSAVPLVGTAQFFRAAAMMESSPDRAAREFEALLHQSSWVEAERRVGGGRLAFIGDALLRLGRPAAAIRAYRRATDVLSADVRERLAVASVCAEILQRRGSEAIASAVAQATEEAPASPWPHVIAAVGLLILVDAERARAATAEAGSRQAPEVVLQVLRAVTDALQGAPAVVTDEMLSALRMPAESAAAVRLLCGSGPELPRLAGLFATCGDEWIVRAPVDPAVIARRFAAALCRDGRTEAALQHARVLERSGQAWAIALAGHIRLALALQRAVRGELEEADRELAQAEANLTSGSGRAGIRE